METQAIVGTPSIAGFGFGNDNYRDTHGVKDLIHAGFRADGFRDVLESVRNEGRDNQKSISDNLQAIERTTAAVNLNVEKTAAATNLNVEKTAAASQLAVEKTAAAGILEAAKNAAALNLAIERTAAAAALAAEKCCCEIKELVRAEAGTTRDLIQSTETQRLRDALADANQRLLTLQLGVGVK